MTMTNAGKLLLSGLIVVTLSFGSASMAYADKKDKKSKDDEKEDALKGAVIGAGVGALVGGTEGAIVGGVAGAIIGKNN